MDTEKVEILESGHEKGILTRDNIGGGRQMNWKAFTPEEVVSLRANPYVKRVTTYMVSFTVEFKERVWDEFQNGRPMATIVADMGFDPEVFGVSRLNGILQHIKATVNSGEDFRDYRRNKTLGDSSNGLPPSKALVHMQHEIAYMKQELEFIKKSF
ncbi:MAG: HTH domain-containing protein [Candidatus Limiplasma sp.]|nr:HTH domain-containing protein [Candidatus Limiplasma sp.]